MMAELEDQIQKVRELRTNRLTLQTEVDQLESDLMSRYSALYRELGQANIELKVAEEKLRAATLAAYQETGNKKPAPGVGIRIVKEMIFDEAEAIDWAVDASAKNCLKLNTSNFKKVAEGLGLPFVEIVECPQATIAKEL
jgi:hypothetical protein